MVANPNRTQVTGNAFSNTEFSNEDLRLIRAMCISANPFFPNNPMYSAWQSVYEKAGKMLGEDS